MAGCFYVTLAGEPDRGRVLKIIRKHLTVQAVFVGVISPIDPANWEP
jgi:5-methyltetrahydropteroyltriglutamate--homocysteine methyltransferase